MPHTKAQVKQYFQQNVNVKTDNNESRVNIRAVSSLTMKFEELKEHPTATDLKDLKRFVEGVINNAGASQAMNKRLGVFAAWLVQEGVPTQQSTTSSQPPNPQTHSPIQRNTVSSQTSVTNQTNRSPSSLLTQPQSVTQSQLFSQTRQTTTTTTTQQSRTNLVNQNPPQHSMSGVIGSTSTSHPPVSNLDNRTPSQVVESARSKLEEMRSYSVENYMTHEHLIPKDTKYIEWVKRKDEDLKKSPSRLMKVQMLANGSAVNFVTNVYTWFTIEKTGKLVIECKAAFCTAFALGSAYVICGSKEYRGPRVEIVSQPAHVFVVVGRKGPSCAGKAMPNYSTKKELWGNEFIVVDAWLGALGNHVIYPPTSNGSRTYFMSMDNLECHWDSDSLKGPEEN